MSNKLMLLPFALLLSPTSNKATHIATEYSCQSTYRLLQDEELLEGLNTYSLLDFTQLEPAKSFKTS